MQAQELFSEARDTVEEVVDDATGGAQRFQHKAADAAEDLKHKASSSSASQPRPAGLYGKDPIPTNTEELQRWRQTHPRPAGQARGGARGGAYADGEGRVEGSLRRSAQSAGDYLRATGREAEGGSQDAAGDVKAWGKSVAGQHSAAVTKS